MKKNWKSILGHVLVIGFTGYQIYRAWQESKPGAIEAVVDLIGNEISKS